MSFEIGQTAGGYEFLDTLDSSKTGVAYKVRNILAQRIELLRILPANLLNDQEQVARFLREMKVHARLQHPNIVTFYNAMEIERQLVMTTELVEGVTLAEKLELGPMRWEEAVGYAGQVLAALSYAHEHGVVHRDITPQHIIITPEGVVKLTGFGLAKGATDQQLTQMGSVVGSLKYISPEQVKGIDAVDARADIYSLGVVLYQCVTGQVPFNAKSQFDIMLAHVNQTPISPRELNADLPKELDRAIMTAMAKEPSRRYQSAGEFQQALEVLPHGVPGEAPEAQPAPPVFVEEAATPEVLGHPEPAVQQEAVGEPGIEQSSPVVEEVSIPQELAAMFEHASSFQSGTSFEQPASFDLPEAFEQPAAVEGPVAMEEPGVVELPVPEPNGAPQAPTAPPPLVARPEPSWGTLLIFGAVITVITTAAFLAILTLGKF